MKHKSHGGVMKKRNHIFMLIFTAVIGCQKQSINQAPEAALKKLPNQTNDYQITNQTKSIFTFEDTNGKPLTDADVLFGPSINEPFNHNFLKTDTNGQIEVSQTFFNIPVTISAKNHIRTTFFGIDSKSQNFQVRASYTNSMIPIHGSTNGYGNLKSDNLADFSIVIQGLSREDFLAFDMNMLISPERDIISIAGQDIKVPSNIAFPKQTETFLMPITFEKANYRFFVPTKGANKIFALHGQFPFKEVVNELRRHTPFASLINTFKFISANLKDINADGSTPQDLNVDTISFTKHLDLKTISIPAEKTMVLISAAEVQNRLYPTDLKKVEGASKIISLNSTQIGSPYFIAALKRNEDFNTNSPKEFGLSASLIHANETQATKQLPFIDLIDTPAVDLDAWKVRNMPKAQSPINELATFASLSQLNKNTKVKTIIWEAYSSTWIDQMNLPLWPEHFNAPVTSQTDVSNTWEISYLGSTATQNRSANLGPGIIGETTHVSYNKKEF
jgi:hypothetical protein